MARTMRQLQVKKVVAVCFLEAAKTTLEQLGAHRLELSEQRTPAPADVARIYGDVRRLRDYLQRCVGGYGDGVNLGIALADVTVLVACCRRYVDTIAARIANEPLPAQERQWLEKKQQVASHWAVELAEKPLLELPLGRHNRPASEAARMLMARLQHKLTGAERERKRAVPLQPPSAGATTGLPASGEPAHDELPPSIELPADAGVSPWLAGPPSRQPSPEPATGSAATTPPLFDHHKVCDPRLRALVGVDLRSYERSLAANDLRLATVLMASVLEAAVLDHVLPRRAEFGLSGAPDSWDVQELLLRALGDAAVPKDRSLVFHLFASRNLLRPAVQMVAPMVVTAASFEVLREFVQRALHELGYGASASPPPVQRANHRALDTGS